MRNFISSLLLCLGFSLIAQINTDRPTQSASAIVLPKGAFQLEAGFLSERPNSKIDAFNVQYVNALFRFGLLEGVEIRLTQNYLGYHTTGSKVNGMSPTTLGTKIHLLNENDGLPQISIIGQITLPNGSGFFQAKKATQELRFNFQNTLSDRLSLGYNLGVAWDNDGLVSLYTAVLGISFSDNLTFFLEPYGFLAKDTPHDSRFNTGLIYVVSDNFQLDISAGNGLTKRAPDYFVSFGAAVLF